MTKLSHKYKFNNGQSVIGIDRTTEKVVRFKKGIIMTKKNRIPPMDKPSDITKALEPRRNLKKRTSKASQNNTKNSNLNKFEKNENTFFKKSHGLKLKYLLISNGIYPPINHMEKLPKLKKFFKMPHKNSIIQFKNLRAYLRKSYRHIEGGYYIFLDIASVGVSPENQKQGIFSKWLQKVESEMKLLGINIMVECVWNHHLAAYLLKQNYVKEIGSIPGNYYKILTLEIKSCETVEELQVSMS